MAAGSISCKREPLDPAPVPHRVFSIGIDDMGEEPVTRSALTSDDIETRITDVTLAVYNDETGALFGTPLYLTSGFNAITLELEPAESVTAYAVANMGDMRAAFPATYSEEAMKAITYRIPGYLTEGTGLNSRGLPMAGKRVCSQGDSEETALIPLKRLVAKLSATLSCEWPGRITEVKIYNLNAVLKPFGESAAQSADDLLPEQEIGSIDPAGVKSGEFVFYVPENLQGVENSIGASKDKSYDNPSLGERKNLASYLETVISGEPSGGASGLLTYHSYLGNNETSDFNIQRNSRYLWTVKYLPENMQNNDWKHQNQLSWKEFTYRLDAPYYIYLEQEDFCSLSRNAQNYRNGEFVEITYGETIPSITYFVTPDHQSVLGDFSLTGIYFNFTGKRAGTVTLNATAVDPYHPEGVSYSQSLKVLDFKREPFIRTPSGDYYPGNVIPVPFGTTWENLELGMKKTLADGTVQTICPVKCGEDKLKSVFVEYGTGSGTRLFDYATYTGDTGKSATFSVTFQDAGTQWSPPRFYVFLNYSDYDNKTQAVAERIYVNVLDSDTETLNLYADRESAYWWPGQTISFEASSTAIHNGEAGIMTDITSSDGYIWSVSPSSRAEISISGGKRVLSASGAGDVTVSIRKAGDNSITASKTVNFKDRTSYRLCALPESLALEKGKSVSTNVITVYKDQYVNGEYRSREEMASGYYFDVKSGSESVIAYSGGYITGRAQGTGILRCYTYDATFETDYRETGISISVTEAPPEVWTIELTPASKTLYENESFTPGFTVKLNGAQASGINAADLVWHTENSTIATVSSAGLVSARKKGATKIYATYKSVNSNKISLTVLEPSGGDGPTSGGIVGGWDNGGQIQL